MSKLCEYEIEILRECAGLKPKRQWGAAVGAALESLRGHDCIDDSGDVTPHGKAVLEDEDRP